MGKGDAVRDGRDGRFGLCWMCDAEYNIPCGKEGGGEDQAVRRENDVEVRKRVDLYATVGMLV